VKAASDSRRSFAALRTPAALRAAGGFTLIEVLVALAILAFAMGALITGMARYADNAGSLREKTLALWVAHNRLTEIDLEPVWPSTGKSDGDAELGDVKWRWFVTVSETPDPDVRRVDIRVQAKGHDYDAAMLSSFVAKAGKQGGP
jgi:general secretion pathway protein I